MLAKINNLPRIKVVGLIAGIVLVAVGIAFFLIKQQSKNSEVDQALERLSLVTDGVEATNRTQRAAGLAAKGKYPASARIAEQANADLAKLSEEAGTDGADGEVQVSVASAAKASEQVETSAKALLAARKAEKGDDLPKLRQARRDLKQSSRQIRKLTSQLNRAKRQLSRAIAALIAQLEGLDSLDESAREDADKAASQLEQSTPPGLEEGIIKQSDAESALLVKRLDWIEPRPGPRSCGKRPAGDEILINEGKVSCRDAAFVFSNSNSRGPNQAIAPSGWDCSSFASDLGGRQIKAPFGYSCVRTDSARISINKEGVEAGSQLSAFGTPTGNIGCTLSATEARCAGNEYIWEEERRPAGCLQNLGAGVGLTGSGQVICGDSYGVAWKSGTSNPTVVQYGSSAQFGPFVCAVEQNGVTCLNRQTKSGFTLSRESLDLW